MTSSPLTRLQHLLGAPATPVSRHDQLAAMEAETMPPPRLHTPGPGDFNVDPNSPFLESGPNTRPPTTAADSPTGKRRGGRFADLVKRVMSLNRQQRPAGEGQRHSSAHPLMMGNASTSTAHVPIAFSPATSSDTAISTHDSREKADSCYDGTTAVDHQMLPIAAVHGSPVYVQPPLGPDYAKMDQLSTASSSYSTFSSYISRVQKFFHEINELPWVAERVTVDYVPGESGRDRHATTRTIHRPLHRPSSWYGHAPRSGNQIDIDPSSSASSPFASPKAAVVPKRSLPQHATPRFAPTAQLVTYAPSKLSSSSSRWEPAYPNGYVPPSEAAVVESHLPRRLVHGSVPSSSSSASEQV